MIIVLIILICIVLITGYIAGNFLFELALDPKASKAAIFSNDDFEAKEQMKLENNKWLEENASDVYIESKKLRLHSYEVKAKKESKVWVIAVHGYTDSAYFMVDAVKQFLHYGYNVLIPAMKIRKKGTYLKEVNTLLANRCKDGDGIFVDVFVYDYCTKNKLIDLPFRILNQLLMPFIVAFDNIGINPLFLKKWFVSNARLYGRINKGSKYIGFDLTWTFKSPFKPFIFEYDDIFPVRRHVIEIGFQKRGSVMGSIIIAET